MQGGSNKAFQVNVLGATEPAGLGSDTARSGLPALLGCCHCGELPGTPTKAYRGTLVRSADSDVSTKASGSVSSNRQALLAARPSERQVTEELGTDSESEAGAENPKLSKAIKRLERRWTLRLIEVEKERTQNEWTEALNETRAQMVKDLISSDRPANRYGNTARLPTFLPGVHVPTLALINDSSGAAAGGDILAIARRTPYYQQRFFNIVDVVKDQRPGGLMDVFRMELNAAKAEAKAMGTRARVISGGGDGTMSFALFIIFAALRADDSHADKGLGNTGNGFIWSDEELEQYFPALVQMPLGTANDLGHALGWGDKYPGSKLSWSRASAELALQSWIETAISPATKVVNFDLWGIMPSSGSEQCNFKLCALGGPMGRTPKMTVDGQKQLVMTEAALPVPLFMGLYFSVGLFGYTVSRFHINRHKTALANKIEYGRQVAGIAAESTPPQLRAGLEGIEIRCGGERCFPPPNGQPASRYCEVGFMNINRTASAVRATTRAPMSSRMFSAKDPAKFNDGKLDMYRMKMTTPLRSPDLTFQSDKKEGEISLTFEGGRGKGVFFQWDGEARFAFSPSGEKFDINLRKIVNIPVVLGPGYDPRVMGDPDNGQPASFAFAGASALERDAARLRVLRCVRGELNGELNATRDEIRLAGLHLSGGEEEMRAAASKHCP